MMNKKSAKTVDEYIKAAPKEAQAALRNLRKTIRSVAPKAEETISYGMPGYKYHGMLVYFAAFPNHCSFFPGRTVAKFKKELKKYKTSKGTIQFSPEHPLPIALVKKIVKARMKDNEARAALKESRKK